MNILNRLKNKFKNGVSFEIHELNSIAGGSADEYLNEDNSLLKYAIDNNFYNEIILEENDDILIVDLDDSIVRFFFTEEKSKDLDYISSTLMKFYENDECYNQDNEFDIYGCVYENLMVYIERYINGQAQYINDIDEYANLKQ